MSDDPLLISTLATPRQQDGDPRATVPCVTVVCHPDPQRIGERALLAPLLVRQPALISRTQPHFAQPGSAAKQPLADPHLSREPIRLLRGAAPGSVRVEGAPGVPAGEGAELSAEAVQRGVVLQLSSRIALLLHETADQAPQPVDGILGQSDAIERVRRKLVRLADLEAPVLVRGETGTGKELIAAALHQLSRRSARPFVAVNMATLTESTAVGALFGYARGAFTGAHARHHGLFERADGGTLLLDELGDAPLSVQAMLLRVLETGRITPLGDEQDRLVDVRVIAATELDLDIGTGSGAFRAALKHRLAGYELVVPPLRERRDDIARLFVHFLRIELRTLGCEALLDSEAANPAPPLRSALIARLLEGTFPGNVRQLNNLARQAAFNAAETQLIDLCDDEFSDGAAPELRSGGAGEDAAAPDEHALLAALERHQFSPLRVARELGVSPSTVHFWMRRAEIRRAVDIGPDELERARAECGGDLAAMAQRLRVSQRALRLQLRRGG